ncbi:MAG: hypothetical protein VKK42_20120 [Lyngbya sp.]|nr:hypothetical protein [Lyngbya sp.]
MQLNNSHLSNVEQEHQYSDRSMRLHRRQKTLESKLSQALGMPIEKGDIWLLGFLIAGLTFIGFRDPGAVTVYLTACLIAISGKMVADYSPKVAALVGVRIKVHHVAACILLLTILVSSMGMPAQALLFQSIEDKVNEILTSAGSTVDAATVTTIFTVLRIIVIFGFLVGGIFLVNQAMQGGDWKPIGNMMAIGLGFVLAIEVLSRLVLGT